MGKIPWSDKKIFLLFLCLLLVPFSVEATVIVVHYGHYPSAEAAALDEGGVNWTDGHLTDDVICTASFAALELQRYLRRMMNRPDDFRIIKPEDLASFQDEGAICLATFDELEPGFLAELKENSSGRLEVGEEGYLIRTVNMAGQPSVLIAAASRVGLLYGAYDFLERLGVRWYAPGEAHEVVPQLSIETFPPLLDVVETPRFLSRGFHAWENRADRPFLLWMARNRLNVWCVEQEDKPFLHKLGLKLLGGGHVLTSLYLGPNLEYPYNHCQFEGDEAKPSDPYPVSPMFQGDVDNNGQLSYFEAHPEWYALINGRRSPRLDGDFGDNFCTSNADAVAEWTKNAIEDLAQGRYKDATLMNAWTLDYGRWCECEHCRHLGSPTDRNIRLIHAYARAIKKAQAEKIINRPVRLLFLAYGDVIEPPTRPLPEDFDFDMCIATFFPIRRCYVHRIDDPSCSVNKAYGQHFRNWFLAPKRHYLGQVWVGEYYNVSGYKCLPVCYMHSMAHDIPFYYSAGARHFYYMHVTTENWGPKALTNWQLARQLWDPETDVETLWNDYFEGRYGPAAKVMRGFYESLETMLANVSELKYTLAPRLAKGEAELFPHPHLQYQKTVSSSDDGPDFIEIVEAARTCRRLIDEALELPLPEEIARRIREDERVFRYAERTIFFYDALCRASFAFSSRSLDRARAALWAGRDLSLLLKSDTISTKFSSSHANAPDALEASLAAPALERLANQLGLAAPKTIKAAPFYSDKSRLLVYRDGKGIERRVLSPQDWEVRRYHILLNFQKVAGPLPPEERRVALGLRSLEEEDLGDIIRSKVVFMSEPGSPVFAHLFIPKGLPGPSPAALCLHQTTPQGKDEPAGLSGNPDFFYALELSRRGFVTLAPDYPGFGEDKSDPYSQGYESATMKGVWNHMRAVDVLVSLPQVDPERVVVIGHSLGGHNAIFVALFDPRLKAVVTSCGFTSFKKYYGGDLSGWSHKGYMPRVASAYGKNPDQMPFDFPELVAALAPRPIFINAPQYDGNFDASGVDDCVRAAQAVYDFLGAKGKIIVEHPETGHTFPPEVRQKAYEFLEVTVGKATFWKERVFSFGFKFQDDHPAGPAR